MNVVYRRMEGVNACRFAMAFTGFGQPLPSYLSDYRWKSPIQSKRQFTLELVESVTLLANMSRWSTTVTLPSPSICRYHRTSPLRSILQSSSWSTLVPSHCSLHHSKAVKDNGQASPRSTPRTWKLCSHRNSE